MIEHKVVVLGTMGAGKTTLVRAIAEGRVVATDVDSTDRDSWKASTTVAMDYGDIALPNGDRLRLFGAPGQARFEFVWPVLLTGAAGALVLVDASSQDATTELARHLHALAAHAPGVPVAIGLTRSDLVDTATLHALQDATAGIAQGIPVVALDARDGTQILMLMDILMSLIEAHALVDTDA